MTVTVDHAAPRRAWARQQYDGLWVQVSGDVPEAVARSAAEATNDDAAAAGRADDTFGEPGGESRSGPVLFLSRTGQPQAVQAWLDSRAVHLGAAGAEARIVPARPARLPKWLDGGLDQPLRLTALAAVPTHPGARSGWTAPRGTTQALARHAVAWGHAPGGTTYLGRGLHQQAVPNDLPGLAEALASGVE